MRTRGSKSKTGRVIKCPKCGYVWKTKQSTKHYVCCSRCKRYFKDKK